VERVGGSIPAFEEQIAGLHVRWLEASVIDGNPATVYLHGVPNTGDLFTPFLERTGGFAPDLPGFGRSAKPANFDYSIPGFDRFLEAFVDHIGLGRFSLVAHDWGAVALAYAQRFPERIERLVLFVCVPLLPGYRWHRIARIWRTPLVGELSMGLTTRWGFRQVSRESNMTPGPLPDDFIDAVWRHFDHGTQRAILKLYRSASEEVLARAGERLGDIRCPALILWPTEDPYIPARFGAAYAAALGGEVRLEMVEDAGHWSWLDRPELIDKAAEFLLRSRG
jgi:pimeloyl-ACP methyl ester carboxylesterase